LFGQKDLGVEKWKKVCKYYVCTINIPFIIEIADIINMSAEEMSLACDNSDYYNGNTLCLH